MKIAILDKLELDKKKIIAILIASLVIAFIDISWLIKLQINGIKGAFKNESAISKNLKILETSLSVLKNDASGHKAARKIKTALLENEAPALMQDIDGVAKKYNIRVIQIKPSLDTGKKQEKADKSGFSPFFISLEISCAYHQLGKFINDLENSEKFITVEEMKIAPLAGQYSQEKISLVLKTYVKK